MQCAQQRLWPDPQPLVERLGQDFFRQLPERPGVYLMQDEAGTILYVGKAKNLRKRLNSYRVANPDRLARRQLRLLRAVVRIELQECADEAAALAREAELLLALKPKFNRAGVWLGPPRFLVWRGKHDALELAVANQPLPDWQVAGPFGSAVTYLRAALARLLWQALNPGAAVASLPEGWIHGRLATVVTVVILKESSVNEATQALTELLAGNPDNLVAWVNEKTGDYLPVYAQEMRDQDLEWVVDFMRAKARRTRPFAEPELTIAHPRRDLSPGLDLLEGS
ncbi:MAG TPA: GIY-YIG nuclease family protein [Verrucomicrobiae bacterium]|jgi:excinuclease UvrABC nuclease subunit